MSAKNLFREERDVMLMFRNVVSRAWISAGWKENPVTRVVPSKRIYRRKEKFSKSTRHYL